MMSCMYRIFCPATDGRILSSSTSSSSPLPRSRPLPLSLSLVMLTLSLSTTSLLPLTSALPLVGRGVVGGGVGPLNRNGRRPAIPEDVKVTDGLCNLNNPCVPTANCTLTVPVVGKMVCECPKGFQGDGKKAGTGCQDVDECKAGTHTCGSEKDGAMCKNTEGSFECGCQKGWEKGKGGKCFDVNECASPLTNTCGGDSTCTNLPGTYRCDCGDKTMKAALNGTCVDLNECEDEDGKYNACAQKCKNTLGGFTCSCNEGYTLNADGHACDDIDECTAGTHKCGQHKCVNSVGSYRCECSAELGYQGAEDGVTCINLNECAMNPNICGRENCCMDLEPERGRYNCSRAIAVPSASSSLFRSPLQTATAATHGTVSALGAGAPSASCVGLLCPAHQRIQQQQAEREAMAQMLAAASAGAPGAGAVKCLERDVEYQGWDIRTTDGVMAVADCQQACRKDPGCDFFSYRAERSLCELKASNAGRTQSGGVVSGPKVCPQVMQAMGGALPRQRYPRFGGRRGRGLQPLQRRSEVMWSCPEGYKYASDWAREKKKERRQNFVDTVVKETSVQDLGSLATDNVFSDLASAGLTGLIKGNKTESGQQQQLGQGEQDGTSSTLPVSSMMPKAPSGLAGFLDSLLASDVEFSDVSWPWET
mmetsp:Transcript_4532/g.10516  ORF Transcript_4532/g.10516 Transcript_4532/m.10516 type:complete len:650 (-) Transcript_4532:688-2637(-)